MRLPIAGLGMLLVAAASIASALTTGIPAAGLPSASQYSATLLPEREGVVSWRQLAGVEPVKVDGEIRNPGSRQEILGLDRKTVRLQGFIVPLDMGDRQKRFLLTATPPHCSFCPACGSRRDRRGRRQGRDDKYGVDPIVMEGRFVVKDDPNGLLLTSLSTPSGAGSRRRCRRRRPRRHRWSGCPPRRAESRFACAVHGPCQRRA